MSASSPKKSIESPDCGELGDCPPAFRVENLGFRVWGPAPRKKSVQIEVVGLKLSAIARPPVPVARWG